MLNTIVSVGQKIEIEITGLTHQGDGVGRFEGIAVFVPKTLPGEKVIAQVKQVKKSFAKAEVVEILQASTDRVIGECTHYKECGGCQLQHLNYEAQLVAKTQTVKDVFQRLGKLEVNVLPTIGMDNPWGYRNKVHFQVGQKDGQVALGFFGEDNFQPMEVKSCLLVDDVINQTAQEIQVLLNEYEVLPYDWKKGTGLLRHVIIRRSEATDQVMVVFVATTDKWPKGEKIAEKLIENKRIVGVVLNKNYANNRVVLGEKFRVLAGEGKITESIGDLKFKLSVPAFFQVNPTQTKKLYEKALQYCDLKGQETVIDAYCGIGTISLFLAQKAGKVIGIEMVPEAIEDAQENAELNNITNTEFMVGRVERVLPDLVQDKIKAEVVVLDPPRKGCEPHVLEAIGNMMPEKIVYISCDPATLARDCKILSELGYIVKEVQPLDMFPMTSHVECVVLIELK